MKNEFSGHIFEKSSNITLDEYLSNGSRVAFCGRMDQRTDGHDETNSHFSQLCDRGEKENLIIEGIMQQKHGV
jgi:hypothetical protein